MFRALIRLSLIVAVLAPPAVEAQVPLVTQSLDSNTVVRLRLHTGAREKATLLAPFGPDSTLFRYCRYPAAPCSAGDFRYVERPASDAIALEVRRGTKALTGALVAAPIGFALGYLAVALTENSTEVPQSTGQRVRIVLPVTALFAGIGALMGAAIEVWRPAP